MKTHELFSGAIVQPKKSKFVGKVLGINYGYVSVQFLDGNNTLSSWSDDFDPVPITAEWLKILEIPYVEKADCWQISGSLMLDLPEEGGTAILHIDHIHFVGNVTYVHALQGIILHLTGKLLTCSNQ